MTYRNYDDQYILRFQKGEELISELSQFAKKQKINGAWLNGIGAACSVTLGYYSLEKQMYSWKDFSGVIEVTSLQGNLSWDADTPIWHIHAGISDDTFAAYGGHVKELKVGATLEVRLEILSEAKRITRMYDDAIGLKLLQL